MLDGLIAQILGALLFGLVFLFLWRQSGVLYFKYWALAWSVESLAWICTWLARETGSPLWLAGHSLFEFGFALSLVAAAGSGSGPVGRVWRSSLRILFFFPAFVFVLELIGWNQHNSYQVLRSLVLAAIYWYSFRRLGLGAKRLFHFTLLALCLLYLQNAIAHTFLIAAGPPRPGWMRYLDYFDFYDLALKTLLAFSAMAMWIESQGDRLTEVVNEMERLRRDAAAGSDLDLLTGLLNPAALRRRIDSGEPFHGVAAVCDLDNFKSINDRFGHIAGDEVLRSIGNLLRSSIRAEDLTYRWGGDEFTVIFADRDHRLARRRMREIEARLKGFRIRGQGALKIEFSWGVAESEGQPLGEAIERADREMYEAKRAKKGREAHLPTSRGPWNPKTSG